MCTVSETFILIKFYISASLTPSEQIQVLITENDEESHVVFCQLDTLYTMGGDIQWREAARYNYSTVRPVYTEPLWFSE